MPTYLTAKDVAENALSTIGAFPASQSQADAGELQKALKWLEMLINFQSGVRPLAGFWKTVDIPVEAGIGDYPLHDYVDASGAQSVFSVSLVTSSGEPEPLDIIYEEKGALEDLTDTGRPLRALVTKDAKPVLKVYPMPVQSNEDAGQILRVRFQTYHDPIDPTGNADIDLKLRPAWYLWVTKRLAYEIGSGPVRTLGERELARLERNSDKLEDALLARDGKQRGNQPPVTQPYGGASLTTDTKDDLAQYYSGYGYSSRNRSRR